MASTPSPKGMLYVLSSPGSRVPLNEFTKWYDDDHVPLRLSVPGILNASRYIAIDGEIPEWLAVYELEDVAVMTSHPYLDQWMARSEYEKDMLARCAAFDRRVYRLTYDKRHPAYGSYSEKVLQSVALAPGPTLDEEEFHAWYLDEHIPLLSAVPGWLRSSRWELVPDPLRPDGIETADGKSVSPFLAVHEWMHEEYITTTEFKAATSTEWRTRVMSGIDNNVEERRRFKTHRLWN